MDNSRSTPTSAELNSSGTNNSVCLGTDAGYSSSSANANSAATSNITSALSQGVSICLNNILLQLLSPDLFLLYCGFLKIEAALNFIFFSGSII